MNRRLRRGHRWLSPLLLFGGLGGLATSVALAPRRTLLDDLAAAGQSAGALAHDGRRLLHLEARDGTAGTVLAFDPEPRTLELLHADGPLAPDLLLYASATRGKGGLPADARLVGSLSELRRGPRPIAADSTQLFAFSLGHSALVAHFALER